MHQNAPKIKIVVVISLVAISISLGGFRKEMCWQKYIKSTHFTGHALFLSGTLKFWGVCPACTLRKNTNFRPAYWPTWPCSRKMIIDYLIQIYSWWNSEWKIRPNLVVYWLKEQRSFWKELSMTRFWLTCARPKPNHCNSNRSLHHFLFDFFLFCYISVWKNKANTYKSRARFTG